jgi:hypothetical protein
MIPTGFPSWPNYFKFTLANEFVEKESGNIYHIKKGVLDRIANIICWPVLAPLNFFLREIKNPLVILSLTITLVALATLIFYPAQFMGAACTILPFLSHVKPWMVKFAVFLAVQMTIIGIGLRALGRLNNQELRHRWDALEICPIFIGAKRINT